MTLQTPRSSIPSRAAPLRPGPDDAPAPLGLREAMRQMAGTVSVDCMVEHVLKRGSHALAFGAVRAVALRPGLALLYREGRYGVLE